MHRVILHGSCRADGRSAALADELFNACIEECPEDGVSIVSVSSTVVGPCIGCDECRALSEEPIHVFQEGDPLLPQETVVESEALFHHCVIDDDMDEVRKHLDAADELIVVCPVYFAGAPAQMKALLDRLQPYYFTDLRTRPKRPAVLHVVGAGGDPHGFEPLIGSLRSALSVTGFTLELVLDWVGKIRADGEITAEAEEYPLPPVGGFGALGWEDGGFADEEADADSGVGTDDGAASFDGVAGEWEPEGDPVAFVGFAEEDFAAFGEDGGSDGLDEPGGPDGLGAPVESGPRKRPRLSVAASAPKPKEASPRSGGRTAKGGPAGKGAGASHGRKGAGKGGPVYGKKNTKKKGNGRGERR